MKRGMKRTLAAIALCVAAAGAFAQANTDDLIRALNEKIRDGNATQEDIMKYMEDIANSDETIKKAMEMSKKYLEKQAKDNPPITIAARNGDAAEVERLIKKRVDLNAMDKIFGFTALMYAAQHNRADIAKLLIDAGAKVNKKNKNDVSALFVAATSNAADVAKLLVAAGADMNYEQKGDGYTPLLVASRDVSFETAKVLVDAGVKVDKRINGLLKHQKTALMEAARNGSSKVVKLLIDAGADVNARDKNGFTPLHYWGGGYEDSSVEVGRLLVAAKADVNARNDDGETTLMSAAKGRSPVSMQILIDAGADVNAKDKNGRTALMNASDQRPDFAAGVKILIAKKAEVNAQTNYGWSPLFYAAANNAFSTAQLLLAAGANPDLKDKKGQTALMHAAIQYDGGPEVAQVIIDGGADINARDNGGYTALEWGELMKGSVAEVVQRAGGIK